LLGSGKLRAGRANVDARYVESWWLAKRSTRGDFSYKSRFDPESDEIEA
jgi:hypothetical protein